MITMEKFLTVQEVADRLDLSVGTIKRMLREGIMPGHKFGKSWRIDPQEFEEFLKRQRYKKESEQES